jgi:DNA-binding transcriptional MerR regulator
MKYLDIGEVAARSGVAVSALRYYEERGLIAPIGRRGQRRVFDVGVVDRLAMIGLGRAAGFSLDEIAQLLAPDASRLDRRMLAAKAEEIDAAIVRLSAMRDALRAAAACPAVSHRECERFQSLLHAVVPVALRNKRPAQP